jgi:hypothetical protein
MERIGFKNGMYEYYSYIRRREGVIRRSFGMALCLPFPSALSKKRVMKQSKKEKFRNHHFLFSVLCFCVTFESDLDFL